MNKMKRVIVVFFFMLASCTQNTLAPISVLKWEQQSSSSRTHRVIKGETLYAIAFRYDKDYKQLAVYNHLTVYSKLNEGQILKLYPYATAYSKPFNSSKNVSIHSLKRTPIIIRTSNNTLFQWHWPLKGVVTVNFMPNQGKKGIDIAGKKGDSIYAARSGTIAYAGNGLSGYGNLIIIKHDKDYLSAYAHNAHNLVHEGQYVKANQKIADIGMIEKKYWGVHFEVRKKGEPVNPLRYLGKMHA